jgi:hypothetical protein
MDKSIVVQMNLDKWTNDVQIKNLLPERISLTLLLVCQACNLFYRKQIYFNFEKKSKKISRSKASKQLNLIVFV